ncbi:MAG: AAA family ATPase, partial [Myxococcota bacterium]
KKAYRDAIDDAVFHGGRVQLGKIGLRRRLELQFDENTQLPFMTWTAGQREFTPLLLGLYHLLPSRRKKKQEEIDWVVIEEPEMGLHPQAITVVMLLVLDLLWRGYRVVISTHSPLVLDIMFTVRTLQEEKASNKLLSTAFGITSDQAVSQVMAAALQKSYRSFFMDFDDEGRVVAKDISKLDPFSTDNDVADWGGLTEFSSRFNHAVAEAVND